MTPRTRALIVLAYATVVTFLLILACKSLQWRTEERNRTCQLLQAATPLYTTVKPEWCR